MYPNVGVSALDITSMPGLEAVVDVVYNPNKTELILRAEDAGVPVAVGGLEMLVAQAVYAAEYFLGRKFEDAPGEVRRITAALRRETLNIALVGMPSCGKSTLGKAFLCELPYRGSITFGGEELRDMDKNRRSSIFGYLGHDPELLSTSVRENICMGDTQDPVPYLRAVCLDREVREMEQVLDTLVGPEGHRLSGGQAQRLALARTLYHKRPVLILDDPFSALDKPTEAEIFRQLRILAKDSIVLLISHRLYLFPQLDRVLWMENGTVTAGTHEELLQKVPAYRALAADQEGGKNRA